ncbi:MAG: carboxypeptidase-like regulatory domain-containing protein [Acidobacteriia bacterium]|nr:carboxypeptidase-like regulatory domain-containing protein [Terriglobia bacterium]
MNFTKSKRSMLVLAAILALAGPLRAQTPDAPAAGASAAEQLPNPQLPGSIRGTVLDPSGAVVVGARVSLAREDSSPVQETLSGEDGQFSFAAVAPGTFHLTITSASFAIYTSVGVVHPGESFVVPPSTLAIATAVTEMRVSPPQAEIAEEQIKEQEKQRVLRIVPNFYVSYLPHAVPLTPKQKFQLAWKTTLDPVTFGVTGAIAGMEQAQDSFSGYEQGARGYGKRYGASYADLVTSTFIGGAILPSVLKQDPRYFYKGSGSKRSRILYALGNAVICKGDNGRWQPNYSNILGNLAAGGISNLYYPANDRGAGLTLESGLIGIGATATTNLLQEFLIRKLTPHVPSRDSANP